MPPNPDDKSKIEELKKSMYSRNAPDVRTRRKLRYSEPAASEVQNKWDEPKEEEEEVVLNDKYEDHPMSFLTKFFIGSIIFFVIAVGVGAYLFFNGSNLISANNIDIIVNGPVAIQGGEPVKFSIEVTNNNNIDLKDVDMNVSFPVGSTDPNDSSVTLTSKDNIIGDLSAGLATSTDVSAIIFGEENMQKQIVVTLTYSIKGSTAVFTKQKSYDVLISSSPITVTLDSISSITSGQTFDMTLNLKSNSAETLKNVLLKAIYPFGYTFSSANITPLSDNATWKIGDLPPGGLRTIVITGKLLGEDTDTRSFQFVVGTRSESNSAVIGTQLATLEQTISIEKPFISLVMNIDQSSDTGDAVGYFNKANSITINWFNNLPTSVANVTITAKLSGTAYDKTKVQSNTGYFDSLNDQVVWSQQTNPELASVDSGANGSVTFFITPTNNSNSINPVINPKITISASVSGNRTQESGVIGVLSSVISRDIKTASDISLSGRIVRSIGPFTNTGPIPPKSEVPTTYSVVWTLGNTTNTVSNATVVATLPVYVKWLNMVSPNTENVTYDSNSGTVTWNAGSIPAYTAINANKRKEVVFQISFLPSINQVGSYVTLINQATFKAKDDFSGEQLQSIQEYLTNSYSTDPTFKSGDEMIGK